MLVPQKQSPFPAALGLLQTHDAGNRQGSHIGNSMSKSLAEQSPTYLFATSSISSKDVREDQVRLQHRVRMIGIEHATGV